MTDHTSATIPQPKDWQAFERHSRLLFEYSLGDPGTLNNGRTGQPQHGVDIYGRRGGGGGHWVGVQCKGKDVDLGGVITAPELKAEVEKTKGFEPAIQEFILVTTAPDDAEIQKAARLLEDEVRAAGRDLSISVWGWGRMQQEIARYPEALRAFHPDGSPFTGEILDQGKAIANLVSQRADEHQAALSQILQAVQSSRTQPQIAGDTQISGSTLDKHLNAQIDTYRDLLRNDQPKTALGLLNALKDQVWPDASPRIRFRLLSNIGAAYHRLGEYEKAADFLLEAAPCNPDDPTSLANKIAALLIKGREAEAHDAAVDALARFPDSPEIALQRLQAVAATEKLEAVWATLSEAARKNPDVIIQRIMALRGARDTVWRDVSAKAAQELPADERLKTIEAEAVLDRVLVHDPSAIGLAGHDIPNVSSLQTAAETIEQAWLASLDRETPPQFDFAHNAALLWNILGQQKRAAQILDEALKRGSDIEETKRLRLALYRQAGNINAAIAIADALPESNLAILLRADLRTESDPEQARAILAHRETFSDRRDTIPASLTILESFITQHKFDEAAREAAWLAKQFPDSPHGPIAFYRVAKARGDDNASALLDDAVARATPNIDFSTRFLLCEALRESERYDDIVDLLNGVTTTSYDSPALRLLILAAVKADRRHTLKELLDQLPQELSDKPIYRRARIAHAISTGSVPTAEHEIRAYLSLRPRDLEMQLQLMQALFRQDKIDELKSQAALPASGFDGEPEDFIALAQFKDRFGDWREAHDLAYRTLLANQTESSVYMRYVATFLTPGHSTGLVIAPQTVEVDMAVGVSREDGRDTVYVIEPDQTLRPTPDYLAPDHAIATLLLGRSTDAELELPDSTKARIAWIKPKVLHALHGILDNFQNLFPDAEGLERVRFDPKRKGGLEPLLERLRERHDAIEGRARLYEEGSLPLALVARSLGTDPVDTFLGLISADHAIRVSTGSAQEREAAFEAVRTNAGRGCVLDAITFHIVRRFGLEDVVTDMCGPIGVVDRTTLRLQQKIFEIEQGIDRNSMSVYWRDGQAYREEHSPEQKLAARDVLQEDQEWLKQHATVLPAEGREDLDPEWREITERFGRSFLDELRAAQGADRLLLCEDLFLRTIGQRDFQLRTAWLQPVLMQALTEGKMSSEAYERAVIHMIDSHMRFISISAPLLTKSLKGAPGHVLPNSFIKLASRLGGPTADLPSHVRVAVQAMGQTWMDSSLTFTVREAMVGTLLENLTKGLPRTYIHAILRAVQAAGHELIGGPDFARYIADWRRWHFIDAGSIVPPQTVTAASVAANRRPKGR